MKYYVGLDVSMKTTFISIVNQEKKIVFESEVITDPCTIFSAIKGTKLDIENCAIESGAISHWLVKELLKRKIPVVCVDSRKMAKILSININKTDKMMHVLLPKPCAVVSIQRSIKKIRKTLKCRF
jgi:transposase